MTEPRADAHADALLAAKAAMRREAAATRTAAHARLGAAAPAVVLAQVLAAHAAVPVAGYLPMRTEADPLPALVAHPGPLAMPVVTARGAPLAFRGWRPGEAVIAGSLGAPAPANGAPIVPRVLVVPLLAFDARGFRLGYGGGFYDRTLAALRAAGPCVAIGFGFAAQQVDAVPTGPHDAALDLIVTEAGVLDPKA